MPKTKMKGSMIPFARIPNTKEVKVGKAAVDKMFGEPYVFVASSHKHDIAKAVKDWADTFKSSTPNILVNVRGLTMLQQYSVARELKANLDRVQLKKVKIDDGPYETSAQMIERYLQE